MTYTLDRRRFLAGAAALAPAVGAGLPALAASGSWSEAGLAAFRQSATDLGVIGMVVNHRGQTLISHGAVDRVSRIASIRKSILSALYGMAFAAPDADPAWSMKTTLAQAGIDDYQPLTALEKTATIGDLLKARSGVYIPSSAETPAMKAARPVRGSHPPGTFWYYNNWDFNVLGEVYQRMTGDSLAVAVEHHLAIPLGWRDYDPVRDFQFGYDPGAPRFAAYNMWMSARDLASFGQLYLDRGLWKRRRLVPDAWVSESTRSWSATERAGLMGGYGYLWWIATPTAAGEPNPIPPGTYLAAGNGGRYVVVMPALDTVVAIQPDEQEGKPHVPLYADKTALTRLIGQLAAAYRA